jgi:hypothetical protein
MILTERQAEERLKSENNLANRFSSSNQKSVTIKEIPIPKLGREGTLNRDTRNEIAIRSKLGEKGSDLAQEFNVTNSAVSNLKNDKVKGVDEILISETMTKVRDKALDRLMMSMGLITDDKLSGCSAKDLSVIASNMGRVVEKTLPKAESHDHVSLIIYTPELKRENQFQVVEI